MIIGSSSICDLIIKDDCWVSEKHSFVYKNNGKYFIMDNNSEYGTLCLV